MAQQAQTQIQNAISQHDRVHCSTNLPLPYTKEEKDIPKSVVERLEAAAAMAKYDNIRKDNKPLLIVNKDLPQWWETLDHPVTNWDKIKRQIYISGLRRDIQTKVKEANTATMEETLAHARDIEVTLKDKKKTTFVASVQSHNNQDEEDVP